MHRLWYVLLPAFLCGQSITHGPLVSNITHSTARITFVTSAHPDDSEVEYGRTIALGNVVKAVRNPTAPFTSMVLLTGLTPGTTYYVQGRINGGSARSNIVTFTTEPEPADHPELPLEPQPVDVSMPQGEYGDSSDLVVAEDCSNLEDVLQRLSRLTGPLNYEVVIPAGTECRGRFVFPPRPEHSGWVVVRSSAVGTDAFPPEGVRWTTDWANSTAKFITTALPVSHFSQPAFFPKQPCGESVGEGGFGWAMLIDKSVFPLLICRSDYEPYSGPTAITDISDSGVITSPGHKLKPGDLITLSDNGYYATTQTMVESVDGDRFVVRPLARLSSRSKFDPSLNPTFTHNRFWKQPPHRTGDTLPETCNQYEWFHNPSTGKVYWCTAPDQWREFAGDAWVADAHSAIIVRPGTRRYRFIGIEVTHQKMPEPLPEGWDKPVRGAQQQGVFRQLVGSYGDEIIWDRCYFHGHPFPQRVGYAMGWSGENIAIINSYFDELSWWRASGYSQLEGAGAIIHYEKGPALVDNNYMAAAGIAYFVPSNNLTSQEIVHDVTFTRNKLVVYRKWRQGDPENNGMIYSNRNSWELKHGRVFKVEGNVFHYNYSGLTAGQFLLLTPRCSSLPPSIDLEAIQDGEIITRQPVSFSAGDVVVISGTNSQYDGLWEIAGAACRSNCTRFTLLNAPAGNASGGKVDLRGSTRGISDVLFRYNAFYEGTEVLRVTGTTGCEHGHLPATRRIALRDNVAHDLNMRSFERGGRVDRDGVFRNGDFGARAVLNLGWLEDLTVVGNQFYGNRGNQPTFLGNDLVSEGLRFSDNVFTFDESGPFRGVSGNGAFGTAALDRSFRRDDHPNWIFQHNVICCGLGLLAPSYPEKTFWPNSLEELKSNRKEERKVLNASLPVLRPAASFSFYGSTLSTAVQSQPESQFDLELAARQGRVLNAEAEAVGAGSAVIRYLAPDSKACSVEFGPSAVWGTGRRVSDGGGARQREVRLTNLSPGLRMHYRILCAAEQPSGSFLVR
jgi:hypothetical protein